MMASEIFEFIESYRHSVLPAVSYGRDGGDSTTDLLRDLKEWSYEYFHLHVYVDGISVKETKVLNRAAGLLKERRFSIFLLVIASDEDTYDAAKLKHIESHLIKKVPSYTQIILISDNPSSDVYTDWLQNLNRTVRIDYHIVHDFYLFSKTYQKKFFESCQHQNCKAVGIDFHHPGPEQVEPIFKFFSEQRHKIQVIAVLSPNDYKGDSVVQMAAVVASKNKLLPKGIFWQDGRIIRHFPVQDIGNKTKITRIIADDVQVPYGRTKLMFIGQGRAGKTSTIRKLMRKGFDHKEESTKGFDVTMVQASNWKRKEETHFMAEYLQNAYTKENIETWGIDRSEEGADESSEGDSETNERDDRIVGEQRSQSRENKPSVNPEESIGPKPVVTEEEIKKYGDIVLLGEKKFGFSIWDFGGQTVFYTLHHLFLTEYGCYILVFDMTKLHDLETREESLEFLKFWLFSKKIHAPSAPLIIVGTHSKQLDLDQQVMISRLISDRFLGHNNFNESMNGKLCFFPIDNLDDEGIDVLRRRIEKVVEEQSYSKERVPSSFLRILDQLLEMKVDYVKLEVVNEVMVRCGLEGNRFEEALDFLNTRGLLTYFSEPVELKRFVVLQPQWMIDGITSIVFDANEHNPPEYDPKFNTEFRKFEKERVINNALLTDIWTRKGYSTEIQAFFKNLMLTANIMCEYNFSSKQAYLVPSLFSAAMDSEVMAEQSNLRDHSFVIDFSGAYNEAVVEDNGSRYVRYLPSGLFERLVCLCVEHSSKFAERAKPVVQRDSALITFGNEFVYELRVSNNADHERLWIMITIDQKPEHILAIKLVKTIYSMISTLKDLYFSSKSNESVLAMSLLIPSKDGILADYENVEGRRLAGNDTSFWPTAKLIKHSKQVKPSDFDFWFDDTPNESLTQPNLAFEKQFEKDKGLLYLTAMPSRPLPDGLQYHCFLSYKQVSAIDLVGKQYYILANRGFKCWWDMQFRDALTLEAMQEGVRNSMVYCLHLSKDIFPVERKPGVTYFVDEEVKMAVALKKPIMMFHHPDTDKRDYWSFGDYIKNAPDVLKPYFSKVESIQLQRRFYLEESTTDQIVVKLEQYLNQQLQ